MVTVKLTFGHLKLVAFLAWLVGALPTITWLTLVQFFQVSYLQVFLPYILLYSLLVSFELVRGAIKQGA